MGVVTDSQEKVGWHSRWREGIRANSTFNLAYRVGVGVVGGVVLVVGVITIPYPGPGWALVFAGLAILATEFEWAHRLLLFARARYDAFMTWFKRQPLWVKAIGVLFTTVVVVATMWLLGAFALVAGWVGIDWPWLKSPIL